MILSLLLFGLYLRLRIAIVTNKAFRNYIGTIHLRFLVKTADGKRGRLFIFDRGKIISLTGADHESDVALVWSDPLTAFRVMISMSEEAMFNAAAKGKVKVEGMAYFLQWFNDGMKIIM